MVFVKGHRLVSIKGGIKMLKFKLFAVAAVAMLAFTGCGSSAPKADASSAAKEASSAAESAGKEISSAAESAAKEASSAVDSAKDKSANESSSESGAETTVESTTAK